MLTNNTGQPIMTTIASFISLAYSKSTPLLPKTARFVTNTFAERGRRTGRTLSYGNQGKNQLGPANLCQAGGSKAAQGFYRMLSIRPSSSLGGCAARADSHQRNIPRALSFSLAPVRIVRLRNAPCSLFSTFH